MLRSLPARRRNSATSWPVLEGRFWVRFQRWSQSVSWACHPFFSRTAVSLDAAMASFGSLPSSLFSDFWGKFPHLQRQGCPLYTLHRLGTSSFLLHRAPCFTQ